MKSSYRSQETFLISSQLFRASHPQSLSVCLCTITGCSCGQCWDPRSPCNSPSNPLHSGHNTLVTPRQWYFVFHSQNHLPVGTARAHTVCEELSKGKAVTPITQELRYSDLPYAISAVSYASYSSPEKLDSFLNYKSNNWKHPFNLGRSLSICPPVCNRTEQSL